MRGLALALALAFAAPAGAQEVVARFTLYAAPADRHGPGGQRLSEPWQVLARDRENVHARALRQFADETDPVFAARAARAQIPRLLAAGWLEPEAAVRLRHGGIVHVELLMEGATLHSLRVTSRRPGPYYPAPAAPRRLPAGGVHP